MHQMSAEKERGLKTQILTENNSTRQDHKSDRRSRDEQNSGITEITDRNSKPEPKPNQVSVLGSKI